MLKCQFYSDRPVTSYFSLLSFAVYSQIVAMQGFYLPLLNAFLLSDLLLLWCTVNANFILTVVGCRWFNLHFHSTKFQLFNHRVISTTNWLLGAPPLEQKYCFLIINYVLSPSTWQLLDCYWHTTVLLMNTYHTYAAHQTPCSSSKDIISFETSLDATYGWIKKCKPSQGEHDYSPSTDTYFQHIHIENKV